jgi:hypothetical protein
MKFNSSLFFASSCLIIGSVWLAGCTTETEDAASDGSGGENAAEQGSGGQAGGGSVGTGGQGPVILPPPPLSCGETECTPNARCCNNDDVCGTSAPDTIFVDSCQALEHRGGSLSADCPESADYCDYDRCQTFEGCQQEGGECGFWVESYLIVGGEEVWDISAELGCVAPEEFVEP